LQAENVFIILTCLAEILYLLNNEMDDLEIKINLILCDWNPIGVDKGIAETEYATYIPQIIKSLKDDQTLMHCLQDMLDKMGLNFDSNNRQHTEDLWLVCSKLLALKK
jgi:hypothetical protein